jgi:hypothetical protein
VVDEQDHAVNDVGVLYPESTSETQLDLAMDLGDNGHATDNDATIAGGAKMEYTTIDELLAHYGRQNAINEAILNSMNPSSEMPPAPGMDAGGRVGVGEFPYNDVHMDTAPSGVQASGGTSDFVHVDFEDMDQEIAKIEADFETMISRPVQPMQRESSDPSAVQTTVDPAQLVNPDFQMNDYSLDAPSNEASEHELAQSTMWKPYYMATVQTPAQTTPFGDQFFDGISNTTSAATDCIVAMNAGAATEPPEQTFEERFSWAVQRQGPEGGANGGSATTEPPPFDTTEYDATEVEAEQKQAHAEMPEGDDDSDLDSEQESSDQESSDEEDFDHEDSDQELDAEDLIANLHTSDEDSAKPARLQFRQNAVRSPFSATSYRQAPNPTERLTMYKTKCPTFAPSSSASSTWNCKTPTPASQIGQNVPYPPFSAISSTGNGQSPTLTLQNRTHWNSSLTFPPSSLASSTGNAPTTASQPAPNVQQSSFSAMSSAGNRQIPTLMPAHATSSSTFPPSSLRSSTEISQTMSQPASYPTSQPEPQLYQQGVSADIPPNTRAGTTASPTVGIREQPRQSSPWVSHQRGSETNCTTRPGMVRERHGAGQALQEERGRVA